jgi:hypothetical protein
MDLLLSSLEHAPAKFPNWQLVLDDLGRPNAERLARASKP